MTQYIRRFVSTAFASKARHAPGPSIAGHSLRLIPVSMLVLTLSVWAAPSVMTWETCVQEAAANNPELRAARANLEAAGFTAEGAYSGYLPQLSAGAAYTDTSGSAAATATSDTTYSTSVSLSQNLFAGFQDRAKVAQSAANRDATAASLAAAKAKLSQDLKSAFVGLKYAQDNVTLTEEIMQRQQENLRLVGLRFESGNENKGSYLLTKASLAQARYDNLQAQQDRVSAQAQLDRVLGRGETEGLEVRGDIPLTEPGKAPDFRQLAREVPDYQQAAAQQKSAAAGVTLARSGLYPSLNLSGSVGRVGDNWTPDESRRSVGLNLNIPLYSGGKDYYATKSAVSSLEAAASNTDSAEHQLLVKLKQAYASYVESAEKLKVDQAFLDAAMTRAEIARSQYNNGLISFSDWNLIENDLIQRQKSYVQSRRDRVVAEAAWEQALGKGVIP
ncbi:MAG: TolC family protein [Gammaproteobacteria bacterium]|nr:TolC family protein [Gammaproteobacteria bacterium]